MNNAGNHIYIRYLNKATQFRKPFKAQLNKYNVLPQYFGNDINKKHMYF